MKKKYGKGQEFFWELFLDTYPLNSRFAESYRTLRTNIDCYAVGKDLGSILVTSAGEEEGKSITAANLAYSFSRAGKSVLMIDADLRKGTLSSLVPNGRSIGLTGLLSNSFGTDVKAGPLDKFGVSDLIRLISFQRRTGVLHLSNGKEEADLSFLQGDLVDLRWVTRPDDKKLATVLIKSGLVTKEKAKDAITRQRDTGQKLGFVLINMGLVREEDLVGPITIHMIEGIRTVLQFKSGRFSFRPISPSEYDRSSFDPVNLNRLYTQALVGEEEIPFLQSEIESAILETKTENLFLLPTGALPPNPSELLASGRMSFLISKLKKKFNILVIDSPPVMPTSDPLVLARYTDGALLVVKAGQMARDLIGKSVEQLKMAKANLLGVVLNMVDIKKDGYYRHYYKYETKYYPDST